MTQGGKIDLRVLGLVVFSESSKGNSYLPMLLVEESEREKLEKVPWIAKPPHPHNALGPWISSSRTSLTGVVQCGQLSWCLAVRRALAQRLDGKSY